jgi:hypothetical protein
MSESPDNGKVKEPLPPEQEPAALPPSDTFKVAEIWIRNGKLEVDGTMEFWSDKIRAVGIFEYCKEIVKEAKPPKVEQPKIVVPGQGPLTYLKNRLRGKK